MAPTGKAYNIDWVFSNNSDVHVAKHLDWFTSYTPFNTKVSGGLGECGGESGLEVLGVGDVCLPVKRDCRKKGRDSRGTLLLRDVLYMPRATCNILGQPRDTHFKWASMGESPSKLIDTTTGACVGLLDLVTLYKLRLSGHSPKQSSLDTGGAYAIRASWPQTERRKWEAFQRKIADSEEDRPANVLSQSADVPLSAVEKKWLANHYGNESEFLKAYGYEVHDEQGRADSRRILRAMIQDDEKGWAKLGLRLGHGDSDEDDTVLNEDEDEDDTSSFIRELEEHPESHAADYHFSEEQLKWIKKHYSYSSNFLLTYGLKFYDDDDCKEGVSIVSQLMKDDIPSDSKERPTKRSASIGKSEQVGKAVNGRTSSGLSIPTIYDETHRGIWHPSPHVASIGNRVCLIAHLEHHEDSTDGSFGVCIAGGSGTFISKELYESIPPKHRPALRKSSQEVSFISGSAQTAIGTTFIPILLKNHNDGKRFRVVIHAYVLPQMLMGMFISYGTWIRSLSCDPDGGEYYCDFGNGKMVTLKGLKM